jgi:transcriptional regulator with XRE-family HTH domain
MAADEGGTRVPLGPVGRYVRDNVERLRNERHLTYTQLAARLSAIGRPIPTLGLSRIEKGTRRVDADDLAALCIALEVSPATLLLAPDQGETDDELELAAKVRVSGYAARQWAAGHRPLPAVDAITWDRPAFIVRMREKELEEMRQQLNFIDHAEQRRAERERGKDGSQED